MLRLEELQKRHQITIQCHDNPDGDAIASGYGLYSYFKQKGNTVRLIYGGRNEIHKANLCLMVETLHIPIEHVTDPDTRLEGLLITVDCQYGAGNVIRFQADEVAIIDHHQIEITDVALSRIDPGLGSCSTLVWLMLGEAGYQIRQIDLGTALYYGLYTDTNQFSELFNPNDMDMRDALDYRPEQIRQFRQTNLSLQELEIAGIALIRNIYNADYHYAIIKAKPCDPNILGLISDFLIQVAEIHSCVVYNELDDGYKLSVRSCSKEAHANELVSYLTEEIGSGGGHMDKAGGFISKTLYEKKLGNLHTLSFFGNRMTDYFDHNELIYAKEYDIDIRDMKRYRKKAMPLGYVNPADIYKLGTPVTIRSIEGDLNMVIDGTHYIMIGLRGEIYLREKERFHQLNNIKPGNFQMEGNMAYTPVIRNINDGRFEELLPYAKNCESAAEVLIYAKELAKTVKIFPCWDEECYQLGRPGDYLCVKQDNLHDIYIVEQELFHRTYQIMTEQEPVSAATG